jgi:hypothetical protein
MRALKPLFGRHVFDAGRSFAGFLFDRPSAGRLWRLAPGDRAPAARRQDRRRFRQRTRRFQSYGLIETGKGLSLHFKPQAWPHFTWQRKHAVAHAHQSADGQTMRFPEPSHFAIAAGVQRAIEPAIGALTARSGNPVKPQHLAVDFNAGQHGGKHFGFRRAEHAHRVAARNLVARMR